MTNPFAPQRLIGRDAELQQISQILAEDGDFLLVGAPGVGRRILIRAAAQQVGARVLEIDCLRTTSANRFLRLLADAIIEEFSSPEQLALIQQWSNQQPLVLEQNLAQSPRLVWHLPSGREWSMLQILLALPQQMAEWLDCRVVMVFLNFLHVRSWDRSSRWEGYLREEIQRQNRVSYALVAPIVETEWIQDGNLHVIPLLPLDDQTMQAWVVSMMAQEGLTFDRESRALELFLSIVQGHLGDAIALARRIWLDHRVFVNQDSWKAKPPGSGSEAKPLPDCTNLIEAHHVHRCALALVEDLSFTFESLVMLLPPSQVRVLESLALDPTDKPQAADYIKKHQLTRGGGLQGALASLEQKGLLYGSQWGYRIALPFLAFWLKQRLS